MGYQVSEKHVHINEACMIDKSFVIIVTFDSLIQGRIGIG